MKHLILGSALLSLTLSFANAQNKSQINDKKLENIIYANENHEKNFEMFLDDWEKKCFPKDSSKENDTVKAIYELYQQLFTPFDFRGKASFNSDTTINNGYKNVVVPRSFVFYLTESGA